MLIYPGAPRIFKAPTPFPTSDRPFIVPEDRAISSKYCNEAAAQSTHQYSPLIAALSVTNPPDSLSDIDIVITRDMLRQLYTFASGRFYSKYTGFDISIELIDNTLFVSRESTNPLERVHGLHPDHTKGYSLNFIERTTRTLPGFEDSAYGPGWQRAIRYSLGSLQLIVLCDIDACRSTDSVLSTRPSGRDAQKSDNNSTTASDLPSAFGKLPVSPATPIKTSTSILGIRILRAGISTPSSPQCFDIRTAQTRYQLHNYLSKLYFGRQSQVVVGLHGHQGQQDRGAFFDIKETLVTVALKQWEEQEEVQEALGKLIGLLQQFKGIAKTKGRCSVKSKRVSGRFVAKVCILEAIDGGHSALAEMVKECLGPRNA